MSANTSAAAPAAGVDWPVALREAAFAALVTLGLCVPIVLLRTVQNMANELVLEPQPVLVAILCAVAFFGRLALTWNAARRAALPARTGPHPLAGLAVLKP